MSAQIGAGLCKVSENMPGLIGLGNGLLLRNCSRWNFTRLMHFFCFFLAGAVAGKLDQKKRHHVPSACVYGFLSQLLGLPTGVFYRPLIAGLFPAFPVAP
jgi:hypothetical protein